MRLTLRGEAPPPLPYPDLRNWIENALPLLETVTQVLEAEGFTSAKRQQVSFMVDGRRVTMETVLMGLRYHLTQEYPYLLRDITEHSRLAIYSSNLNDEYRVAKLARFLAEADPKITPQIVNSLEILRNHLNAFPDSVPDSAAQP